MRIASFFGLMESTSEAAPLSAPMTLDSWLSAAEGDASGFWFQSLSADLAFPKLFVWGEYAADRPGPTRARRRATSRPAGRPARSSATPHRRSSGAAASWSTPGRPHRTTMSTAACGPRTSRRSSSAARSTSRRRRRSRPRSSSRTCRTATRSCCPGSGTRRASGRSSRKPARRLINTFLDSGRVDDSLYKPQTRRLHARGHADGARQGHRRRDGRPRAAHGPLAAVDGPPGAQARTLRTQGERGAAVALPDRARPRRLVPRRPDRDDDHARRPARRRAARGPLRRRRRSGSASTSPGSTATGRPRPRPPASRAAAAGALVGAWLGFHATVGLLGALTAIVGASSART